MFDPNSITNGQPSSLKNIRLELHSQFESFKKLLIEAKGDRCQIQKAFETGLLPMLIESIQKDDEPQRQLEAVSALRAITEGGLFHKSEIVNQGALPTLVKLLLSGQPKLVVEEAIVAIQNLTSGYRDLLLDHGVLLPLIALLEEALTDAERDLSLIKLMVCTLSDLCIKYGPPAFERVSDAICVLCSVIGVQDMQVNAFENVLWALCSFSDREDKIARILECNIVPSIMRLLDCGKAKVVVPALKILGNILSNGTNGQAVVFLKASSVRNYMKKLFRLLKDRATSVRAEVCKVLADIIRRNSEDNDLVLGSPECLQQLIEITFYDNGEDARRNAAWTLSKTTYFLDQSRINSLNRSGVFDCMYRMVQQSYDEFRKTCGLVGIRNFLLLESWISQKKATNNKYLIRLKQKGAIEEITKMRKNRSPDLSEKAIFISNKFFKRLLLRKKLRLKRAIVCFRNERHSLFGIFLNKKKRLAV